MTNDNVFDSSSPGTRKVEPLQIIEALAVDPVTAGDAWVRFAKTRFKGLMDMLNARHVDHLPGAAHPQWTKQESVVISIHDKDTRAEAAELIEQLIDRMAHEIMELKTKYGATSGRHELVLINALSVRLHYLGGGFFNFVIKQQFTVGSDER